MNKKKVTYYVLLVIISALFLLSGITKVLGQSMSEAGFKTVGLPIWFMYVIGIGEILGVVGLWFRQTFRYAYEGLFLVLLGAFGTTIVFVNPASAIFPLICMVILGCIVWLHRKSLKVSNE